MTAQKLAAALIAFALLFTGCSGGGGAAADIDPDAAARKIIDAVEFRDTLVKAEDGAAESFYKLDDTITGYAIYISGSGATAEEVAVLKVDDPKNVESALAVLNKRVEDLIFRFQDYVPAEMTKLNDPVMFGSGNLAVLVLADDREAAKKAAEDAIK